MAEFDIVCKQLIQAYPTDFVRFTLQQEDVEVLEVIEAEQPIVESRSTDSLIRVRIQGEEVLVHNEFQTSDSTHPPMPRRMAGYIGRGIESQGCPICSNVIYLRPDAGKTDPGHYVQDRPGYRVIIEYKVMRLVEIDGQEVIDTRLVGLIPFAPLMKPPEGMVAVQWLRRCVQTADELPLDRPNKANFLTDLAILSGLVHESQTIIDIISEETMYESSIVQHFTERGIQQGIQQGVQQGVQQGRILAIVDLISDRFSPDDAERLKPTLFSIQDANLLRRILVRASEAKTVAEFQNTLNALIS